MTTVLPDLQPGIEGTQPDLSIEDAAVRGARTRRRPLHRLVRGRPEDPRWVRPALLVLLGSTAFAYLWALGDSGWANAFYSAAVQAGTKSWKAFFFGSSDASNFITVDKPPAACGSWRSRRGSSD